MIVANFTGGQESTMYVQGTAESGMFGCGQVHFGEHGHSFANVSARASIFSLERSWQLGLSNYGSARRYIFSIVSIEW